MDPTAAATIAAATAAVQALSEALQPGTLQHHKVSLPSFWTEDPIGWFHHAEAEFLLARIPANSYICYMHIVRALSSDALTAVRDLIRDVTAATPDPYTLIKEALLARFTPSPLQMCFRLLDMPPLGDRRPSALFSDMQALLPRDANILFNVLYLRRLPESMHSALTDRGDLPLGSLPLLPTSFSRPRLLLQSPLPCRRNLPPHLSRHWLPLPQTHLTAGGLGHPSLFAGPPLRIAERRRQPHAAPNSRALPPTPHCVSTTTISAEWPTAVNHPASGRETSKGPGGTPFLAATVRGRTHLHPERLHVRQISRRLRSRSQPTSSSFSARSIRPDYC
jgi:hypothetical protein